MWHLRNRAEVASGRYTLMAHGDVLLTWADQFHQHVLPATVLPIVAFQPVDQAVAELQLLLSAQKCQLICEGWGVDREMRATARPPPPLYKSRGGAACRPATFRSDQRSLVTSAHHSMWRCWGWVRVTVVILTCVDQTGDTVCPRSSNTTCPQLRLWVLHPQCCHQCTQQTNAQWRLITDIW